MLTGAKATRATIYSSDFYPNTLLICYALGYKQTAYRSTHRSTQLHPQNQEKKWKENVLKVELLY